MEYKNYITLYCVENGKETIEQHEIQSRNWDDVTIPKNCYKFEIFSTCDSSVNYCDENLNLHLSKLDYECFLVGTLLEFKDLNIKLESNNPILYNLDESGLYVKFNDIITPLKNNRFIDERDINTYGHYIGEDILKF